MAQEYYCHHQPRDYYEEVDRETAPYDYRKEENCRHQPRGYYEEVDRETAPYDYRKEEKRHKHREELGVLGAAAGGAFALYEGQKAMKDPVHANRHMIESGVGAVAALGSAGYAFHEHKEKKHFKEEAKTYDYGYY